MLLVLAALLVQPVVPVPAPSPDISVDNERIIEARLVDLPIQRNFLPVQMIAEPLGYSVAGAADGTQDQTGAGSGSSSSTGTAPASPSSSAPIQVVSSAPAGESTSRTDSSSPTSPAIDPAAFRAQPYRPTVEAGRLAPPRKWLLLSAAAHGAATFDAWSTRRIITNGTGYEMDPLLKPFANSSALYAAVQVAPVAFDFLSLRMLHSEHGWARRMWWLPQSLSAGASFFAGVHNTTIH